MAARSESFAYANSSSNPMSRLALMLRSNKNVVTASACFLFFILLVTSDLMMNPSSDSSSNGLRVRTPNKMGERWGGAAHAGHFKPKDAQTSATSYAFAAVTDMDQLSKVAGDKLKFHSLLMRGHIEYDASQNRYTLEVGAQSELISGHNEAGRGMELSELTLYDERLLAFDDRTGSVFEIVSEPAEDPIVVPRFVITEGEGDTDKGMKWEWATVKDGSLYLGSMGKEYTRQDGSVVNTNNLWISVIDGNGAVKRVDWSEQYHFVRDQLGATASGYAIHEAVLWSEKLKRWIFLPRRVSNEMYNEVTDEKKGSNKVLLVNDKFTESTLVEVKMATVNPLHGFSTAAFVPNSDEKHILALRSVEEDCVGGDEQECKQRSYAVIFDVTTGEVLMDEVQIDGKNKFEGVEFALVPSKVGGEAKTA